MSKLSDNYEKATMAYIEAFVKKQGIEFEDWVDSVGCTCLFADWYLSFHDVKMDIDKNAPKDLIWEWYDGVLDHRNAGNQGCGISYENYIKGVRFTDL